MKKKFLCSAIAFSLAVSMLSSGIGGSTVYAAESSKEKYVKSSGENIIAEFDDSDMITDFEVSEVEMPPEVIHEVDYNHLDHAVEEKILEEDVELPDEGAGEEDEEEQPNTDPNNAYIVTNNTAWNGTIENANEFRWYAFNAEAASKVTIFLQMNEALDADLYLFGVDDETSSLELIDGSATEGVGVTELLNTVVDSGIYFFAISGCESTGNYAFAFFQSSVDVANEINDSLADATTIGFGNVTGVIDNPLDYDYYKITLDSPAVIKYGITSTDGYSIGYAGSTGTGAGLYSIDNTNGFIKANAGTYYFAVSTNDNSVYSATSTYTVNFKKIANVSDSSSTFIVGISESAGIVLEVNNDATVNYVNGNLIDISYSYVNNLSNSAGGQYYNISIDPDAGEWITFSDVYEPAAVYYHSSTKPAMNVSSRPALLLTYVGNTQFYRINCLGTGAYSMNTYQHNFNNVTVLIDPSTGRLIDIVEFNYYYDFAPVGSNSITWTRSYSMNLYEDNGEE
ncbi:hypothetical protein SAMN04487761_11535 [Lachnospiraceae bacterium C7]|nr:hypothetical protein SAMN04487761_11535 [Lachnospiraceae bacterium C7]